MPGRGFAQCDTAEVVCLLTRYPDAAGTRPSRHRKSSWISWQTALLLVGALIVAAIVYVATSVTVAVQEIQMDEPPPAAPEVAPAPVKPNEPVNILVMGLDDDKLRSDTLMLVSVDTDKKKVGVIQIPRDTRARLAGKGTFEKINAAYAYGVGDKQFPAHLRALKTVEDLLEISIHHTVVIELDAFRKIVDEVGGVEIDIPRKMEYDDPEQNLHIHFEPGPQKLDGKQALEFVRWRRNNDGTGYPDADLGRIRAQQQFLRSLMAEALKLTNLPQIPVQATRVAKYVKTTLQPARLLQFASLAPSVDVEFATLPGVDAYLLDPRENAQISYYLHDPVETKKLVDRLVGGLD